MKYSTVFFYSKTRRNNRNPFTLNMPTKKTKTMSVQKRIKPVQQGFGKNDEHTVIYELEFI